MIAQTSGFQAFCCPWRIHETNGIIYPSMNGWYLYSNCIYRYTYIPYTSPMDAMGMRNILLGTTVKNRHILESNTCHMSHVCWHIQYLPVDLPMCVNDAAFSQDKNWKNRQTKNQYRLQNPVSCGIQVGGWTNPFETCESKWESSPRFGVKIQNLLKPT